MEADIHKQTQRRRDVQELTISRASIEQDRFTRLVRVKKTLHSFEQLRVSDRRKVADLLTADPSFGDSESSTLLQDSVLGKESDTIEPTPVESSRRDAPPPAPPEQVLRIPTVCYQSCCFAVVLSVYRRYNRFQRPVFRK
jgi:hypothetical protein